MFVCCCFFSVALGLFCVYCAHTLSVRELPVPASLKCICLMHLWESVIQSISAINRSSWPWIGSHTRAMQSENRGTSLQFHSLSIPRSVSPPSAVLRHTKTLSESTPPSILTLMPQPLHLIYINFIYLGGWGGGASESSKVQRTAASEVAQN